MSKWQWGAVDFLVRVPLLAALLVAASPSHTEFVLTCFGR